MSILLSTPRFCLIVALAALLVAVACAKNPGSDGFTTTRAGRTGSISISASMTPGPGGSAIDGAFMLSGVAISDSGFASDNALVVETIDLESGLASRKIDLADVVETTATFFNPSTGVFQMDGNIDFILGEGRKLILVTATNPAGTSVTWTTVVEVPAYNTPSYADAFEARRTYGSNLLLLFYGYQNFLASLNTDPIDFPYHFTDLALLTTMTETFLGCLVVNPDGRGWTQIGEQLENRSHEILQIGELGNFPPQEAAWREGLHQRSGWYRWYLGEVEAECGGLGLLSRGYLLDYQERRPGLVTFYGHTFAQTSVEEFPDPQSGYRVARFTGIIYQDEGTPQFQELVTFDPGDLQPGTADPNDPVWRLVVTAQDTDGDELIDEADYELFADLPPDGELKTHTADVTSNHLIEPFLALFGSRSFKFMGQ